MRPRQRRPRPRRLGSVEEKRATAGVLVTTAWAGAETKAFAARNNRLRIIEGGELKHLLAGHLDLDARIDPGRPPRRKPQLNAKARADGGRSTRSPRARHCINTAHRLLGRRQSIADGATSS